MKTTSLSWITFGLRESTSILDRFSEFCFLIIILCRGKEKFFERNVLCTISILVVYSLQQSCHQVLPHCWNWFPITNCLSTFKIMRKIVYLTLLTTKLAKNWHCWPSKFDTFNMTFYYFIFCIQRWLSSQKNKKNPVRLFLLAYLQCTSYIVMLNGLWALS